MKKMYRFSECRILLQELDHTVRQLRDTKEEQEMHPKIASNRTLSEQISVFKFVVKISDQCNYSLFPAVENVRNVRLNTVFITEQVHFHVLATRRCNMKRLVYDSA